MIIRKFGPAMQHYGEEGKKREREKTEQSVSLPCAVQGNSEQENCVFGSAES